ncbi:MAG: hypothetical protein MRJ96_04835 [Nitrospirales bacterium]|nr:hypothetical protein [Nitrospira sp.]MDR4500766.1 hypothetical protein [Nitrospirales bacterium]
MESLPEFVGTVHIFLGPYRGNPIALYMRKDEAQCHISPRVYPWNKTVGSGETPNKAAAAFEAKWKENELADEMYSGPHWEGGIKPEKPKPPPKPAATSEDPKVAAPAKPATTAPVSNKTTEPVSPPAGEVKKAEAAQTAKAPAAHAKTAAAPPASPTSSTQSSPKPSTPSEGESPAPPGAS